MLSKSKAIKKINEQAAVVESLVKVRRDSSEFKKWKRDTEIAIDNIFGHESRHIKDFQNIKYSMVFFSSATPESEFQNRYIKGLENAKAVLVSMAEEIDEYWDNESEALIKVKKEESYESISAAPVSNKIFIIHGHDSAMKESVARFIMKVGLDPIILHEQPNQGKTIIEKFEVYSDVQYAIALLTPDDTGSSIKDPDSIMCRARQNVIFEFGYFMGKLGRKNVVGLIKEEVEIPSDYSGVVYIPIDESGAWKFLLVKELKHAGFDIDANKAV